MVAGTVGWRFENDGPPEYALNRNSATLHEVTHPALAVAGLDAVSADPACGRAWRPGRFIEVIGSRRRASADAHSVCRS